MGKSFFCLAHIWLMILYNHLNFRDNNVNDSVIYENTFNII